MAGEVQAAVQPFYVKVVVGLIIILMGLIVGQLTGRFVRKVLLELHLDRVVHRLTRLRLNLASSAAALARYGIYMVFFVWALERMGLGAPILNILAGAAILLVVVACLLAIKDFVPNALAGFYAGWKGIVKKGDVITIGNVSGRITDVELLETRLETEKGDMIVVPNRNLLREVIVKVR